MLVLSVSIWAQRPYPQWFTDRGQETDAYAFRKGK